MTHDQRLATIEQIMNGKNPFEKVSTPLGEMERWRAEAMLIGTTGGMQSVLQTIRNDAAELEKKAVALDAKKSAVLSTVNRLLRFMSRVDALTSRVEKLEAQRKADEAVQRKLDEEPIELPPDIAEYQTRTPPAPIEEGLAHKSSQAEIGDETHQPGGELHSITAKEEEQLPEPPLETEADTRECDAGKVPLSYGNVPMSYVKGAPKDATGNLPEELEQDLPEPPPEPRGSVYPQPVSISLNKA
jgi:hypothetical protein